MTKHNCTKVFYIDNKCYWCGREKPKKSSARPKVVQAPLGHQNISLFSRLRRFVHWSNQLLYRLFYILYISGVMAGARVWARARMHTRRGILGAWTVDRGPKWSKSLILQVESSSVQGSPVRGGIHGRGPILPKRQFIRGKHANVTLVIFDEVSEISPVAKDYFQNVLGGQNGKT